MTIQLGDIGYSTSGKHWLIHDIKEYGNDVYQLGILVLETGEWGYYTSPFGLDIPSEIFYKLA